MKTDSGQHSRPSEHLSPEQFDLPTHEGWTGPLGSFGEPGPAAAYWQDAGTDPYFAGWG